MKNTAKKDTKHLKKIIERIPRALAAAILSAALSAFVLTGIPIGEGSGYILPAMLLCALFTGASELAALPNVALLCGSAAFLCAGGVMFFVPMGEVSIFTAMTGEGEAAAAVVLAAVLLLCGALCLAVSFFNRIFAIRCIIAGSLAVMLTVLAWLRFSLLKIPAILIVAYILIVLCQVCASKLSSKDDKPKDAWFIIFSLLTAVIIFSLPTPSTRIQWEKLFEMGRNEKLSQLGEALGVEQIEAEAESGYSEDQSDLGCWIELTTEVKLHVEFSEVSHSDRLTGCTYDRYLGTGWVYTEKPEGLGYGGEDGISEEMLSVSDICGSVRVMYVDGTETDTLFYPPYTFAVTEGEGEYEAYYYREPCEYSLSDEERDCYLALPDKLPKRVRNLAAKETYGCRNDAEKAKKLMALLSDYRYETYVSGTPKGRDMVDYFLFDSKKGYCAHFASSMTVMARCAGIPARYVLGYHIDGDCARSEVAGGNAHAWAELYIDGAWVVYDPVSAPAVTEESETDIVGVNNEKTEKAERKENPALRRILLYSYIILGAAVLLFIIFRPALKRLSVKATIKHRYGGKRGYKTIAHCVKLLWVLSSCGVKKAECETLSELAGRIKEECTWLGNDDTERIANLLRQTGKVLYSDGADEETDKKLPRAVKKAYIRAFGASKYIKGSRRASL